MHADKSRRPHAPVPLEVLVDKKKFTTMSWMIGDQAGVQTGVYIGRECVWKDVAAYWLHNNDVPPVIARYTRGKSYAHAFLWDAPNQLTQFSGKCRFCGSNPVRVRDLLCSCCEQPPDYTSSHSSSSSSDSVNVHVGDKFSTETTPSQSCKLALRASKSCSSLQ